MVNVLTRIVDALQYDFILKALLVGSLISLCCSFLGVFLVLKKYSMIGHGLAHVGFATVAIALLLSMSPIPVSIPLVILSSFLIMKLNEKAGIDGDAAIGLVASFAVAVGYFISSLSAGFNVDLSSYLFGSILLLETTDVWLSVVLSAAVILTVVLFYNELFSVTYDEEFSTVSGLNTKMLNYLISALTSVTIVLGIRMVGTLLISSLIVFPTVSALQISKGFKGTIAISSVISVSCVILGVLLSFLLGFPAGATIVMLNAIIFVVCFAIKKMI